MPELLLAGRPLRRDLDRLERMAERIGELLHPLGVVLPSEHLVDHLHVAEQVGDDAVMGLALDLVEQDRAAAVHVLLQAGDFEIGIDLLVGLDQIALRAQPVERGPQIEPMVRLAILGRERFLLAQLLLHCPQAPCCGANAVIRPGLGLERSKSMLAPGADLPRGAENQLVPLHRFLSIIIDT